MFLALSTQWRTVAVSTMTNAKMVHTGIDYSAVEPVLRMLGIKSKHRVAVFSKLRVMEDAALDAMHPD